MAELTYLMCFVTSVATALLLIRSYLQTRSELLLWSSLCFLGLALNNALLVVDLMLVPDISLALLRSSVALVAVLLLLYGLIWHVR